MFVFIFVFVFVFVFAVDISDHLFSAALALEPDFALNYFGNTFALLLFVQCASSCVELHCNWI